MRTNFNQMLLKARKRHCAVGQFNINNMEWTKMILLAAKKCRYPIILGITKNTAYYLGGFNSVSQMVNGMIMDLEIDVDVCLNLDHGESFQICKEAIDSGFDAVMFDGSRYPIEENINTINKLYEYAQRYCCSIEGQIGTFDKKDNFASLDEVKKFVDNANFDCLAVSCGSKHATIVKELNLEILEDIKKIKDINISLHGGSGVPHDLLNRAINIGCCKVNINTENMIIWSNEVKKYLSENNCVYSPRDIIGAGLEALENNIEKRIREFAGGVIYEQL